MKLLQKILVPTDFSPSANDAVRMALDCPTDADVKGRGQRL